MKEKYWRRYPQLTKKFRMQIEDILTDEFVDDYEVLTTYLKRIAHRPELIPQAAKGLHMIQGVFIKLQRERLRAEKRGAHDRKRSIAERSDRRTETKPRQS